MKRWLALLCVALLICPTIAAASNAYIIPDSNKRDLTWQELWEWQYDALGYIFNEIFARHGYHFEPGKKYDNYFRAQLWYHENEKYPTNQQIYDHLMNDVEWRNEALVKQVRAQMRAMGTTNPGGKQLPEVRYEPPIPGAFSSFFAGSFSANQKLPVYSGPGKQYYRAADGKAMASTNGYVYVGGWENGWLMVMYWTNNGNVRVGFVESAAIKERVSAPQLLFSYLPTQVLARCDLTDDPVATYQTMATLQAGDSVLYLSEYINEYRWAYVEALQGGETMRGFIRADALLVPQTAQDDDTNG